MRCLLWVGGGCVPKAEFDGITVNLYIILCMSVFFACKAHKLQVNQQNISNMAPNSNIVDLNHAQPTTKWIRLDPNKSPAAQIGPKYCEVLMAWLFCTEKDDISFI